MRPLVFILLNLLSFGLSAQVEQYNVLNVAGQIKVKGSGKLLAKGDVISSEDQVVFMAPTAMAAVFSPSKGRFTMKAKPDQKTGGEFYAYVKSVIVPNMQTLATRGGEVPGLLPPDANNELCGREVLMLEGAYLPLDGKSYAVDSDHFFYLKINWNGESISKRLTAQEGKLSLSPTEILQVDGQAIMAEEMSEFKLFHFDNTQKKSVLVCEFTPLFVNQSSIQEEASIIVNADKAAGFGIDRIREDVRSYLHDYYGMTLSDAYGDWFRKHFAQ